MKKALGFIIDVLLIAAAFAATDIIMYKLESENWVLDLVIFAGLSLVLEGGKWLLTGLFRKKQ